MKKLLLTLVLISNITIVNCLFAINRDINFLEILIKEKQGDILNQKEIGEEDFCLTFKDVTDIILFKKCKFLLDNKPKDLESDLSGVYNTTDKTYKITLTAPIKSLIQNCTFIMKSDKDTKLYSFDINVENGTNSNPNNNEISPTQIQLIMQESFEKQILPKLTKELDVHVRDGAYVDKFNIIHLFVDEFGKFYGYGIPTVATEKNLFQIHILMSKQDASKYSFSFLYVGEYLPTFNIAKNEITPHSGGQKIIIELLDGAIKGPYTGKFSFSITRYIHLKEDETKIVDAIINIPKLYHVSISTGLFGSTLQNPQNIQKMALPNGKDSTLIADDPNARGIVTIMATYYPKGRSFLFPPNGSIFDASRFGVQVGAQLNDKLSENFFLGLSHDFARGGSISYGAHFGRRNYVAGKRNFNFGKEVFDLPDLNVKKEWAIGFYFGVVIDTRVAIELLKGLGNSN